jgi:hypothetical protein
MTTLKQNLMDRSLEIKVLVERELRALAQPCSITDMVKRVAASRMPVEKHLKVLLATPEFSDISIIRVGGSDVIYKVWAAPVSIPKAQPEVERPAVQPEGNKSTEVEENGRTDDPNVG